MSARDELRRLWERDGFLAPAQVLEDARREDSPLHDLFDWDDSTAAESWRLHQAQSLIRRCKITVVVEPERVIRVRSYTAVPEKHYQPTEVVMADQTSRDVVMQQLERDIAALRNKYRALIDFDAALRAIVLGEQAAA